MTPRVIVRVPATSANVGPGFDAYGLAIDQHLFVATAPDANGQRVTTTGEGADELPTDDDNLVWRSVEAFCRHFDVDNPEVALQVHNKIPVERGLGSSSAAIVAGLTIARAITGVTVGDLALVQLATAIEGHPDNVAPAILGGFVACTVTDDGAVVVRRINPVSTAVTVFVPGASRQNTDASRATLPDTVDRSDLVLQASRAGHVLGAVAGVWPVAPAAAGDQFHEPARLAAGMPTGALLHTLRDAGLHAWLSGSGPSLVAFADDIAASLHDAARDAAVDVHTVAVDRAGTLTCWQGGCAVAGGGTCVQCPWESV